MITVTCSCGRRFRAKEELAGKTAQCPHCQEKVLIPAGARDDGPMSETVIEPPAKSRKRVVLWGGILVGVLGIALILYFGLIRSKSPRASGPSSGAEGITTVGSQKSAPVITATPNPVPAGSEKFGTTTITWDTGDGSIGEVYVSTNGGEEKRFSGATTKGSQDAAWIGKGVYEFRLYAGKEHKTLLGSVRVTRNY
jgi:hypothetical protein